MIEYVTGFLGTACLGIVGWAFNLSGRVKVLEQQHLDLKELINLRFDASDSRLTRIEEALNGSLKH